MENIEHISFEDGQVIASQGLQYIVESISKENQGLPPMEDILAGIRGLQRFQSNNYNQTSSGFSKIPSRLFRDAVSVSGRSVLYVIIKRIIEHSLENNWQASDWLQLDDPAKMDSVVRLIASIMHDLQNQRLWSHAIFFDDSIPLATADAFKPAINRMFGRMS